jgi:hypothetical protein
MLRSHFAVREGNEKLQALTVVMNLATGKKQLYILPPRQAVIAAYAQEHRDRSTLDYEKRYGSMVEYGNHTVLCGDWSAFDCGCHTLSLAGL